MTNVTWYQILNWSVTIIPIFVGMTLYQRIYASKGPKKQKLGLWSVRMANNGFHGSLGMLAKVAATKACLTVLQMLHQWTAKWDYLYYWLPCYRWINGVNAFILFFGYTFYRR
jgi:hypothetical protein